MSHDSNTIVLDADLCPLLESWYRDAVQAAGDDIASYFAEMEEKEILEWAGQMTRIGHALGESFSEIMDEELHPHEAAALRHFLRMAAS